MIWIEFAALLSFAVFYAALATFVVIYILKQYAGKN